MTETYLWKVSRVDGTSASGGGRGSKYVSTQTEKGAIRAGCRAFGWEWSEKSLRDGPLGLVYEYGWESLSAKKINVEEGAR